MSWATAHRRHHPWITALLCCGLLLGSMATPCQTTPPPTATTPATANAAPANAPPSGLSNAPRAPEVLSEPLRGSHSFTTDREQVLSIVILAFGTLVLIVQYLLLRTPRRSASEILQLLCINLVVTGTLFLISAGYDAQSIAPGLGLFGTIAGYVLGRRSGSEPTPTPPGGAGGA